MVYRLSWAVVIAVFLLPATSLAQSQSAPPSAATKQLTSDVRTLLEQKERQLRDVVLVLQKLRNAIPPVPGRDPIVASAQRIALEKNKTDLLIATDETAAELKEAESKVAKQRPQKAPENTNTRLQGRSARVAETS